MDENVLAVISGVLSLLLVISEWLSWSTCRANSITQFILCACSKPEEE